MRIGHCLLPPTSSVCLLFSIVVSALAAFQAFAADPAGPDGLKEQADRWIALERRIADEKNQWRTDKEVLQASVRVLEKERSSLLAQIEANELATALFKSRLERAQSDLAAQEGAQSHLGDGFGALEERMRGLVLRLPDPLKQKLRPQLQKLDAAPGAEPRQVSERTQTLVSILSAIDQFNNTLTLTHQLREVPGGQTLDVKVLYWGLATAYAVDGAGQRAWRLIPRASGWEWTDEQANVGNIKALVETHEKQRSPQLVVLPAATKGVEQ